jgi:peptidoglycan hydrolase-like protein with peptidoglycan-binding domain
VPDIRFPALAALLTTAVVIAVPTSASAAVFGTRPLSKGATGSDVKTAQVLLQRVGNRIVADGQYGPATVRAAKSFERSSALTVDGRLDPTDAPVLRQKAAGAVAQRRSTTVGSSTEPDTPTATATDPDVPATTTAPMGGATPADPVGVPGATAVLNPDGTATAPAGAPAAVQAVIAAGNEIATKPYRYGGGHRKWKDSGYDCSGSVSYALHGASLVDESMPSGSFETWGDPGKGQWVTLYSKASHMYMTVAGLRFDTSGAQPSRWQTASRSSSGFVTTHPPGL